MTEAVMTAVMRPLPQHQIILIVQCGDDLIGKTI